MLPICVYYWTALRQSFKLAMFQANQFVFLFHQSPNQAVIQYHAIIGWLISVTSWRNYWCEVMTPWCVLLALIWTKIGNVAENGQVCSTVWFKRKIIIMIPIYDFSWPNPKPLCMWLWALGDAKSCDTSLQTKIVQQLGSYKYLL